MLRVAILSVAGVLSISMLVSSAYAFDGTARGSFGSERFESEAGDGPGFRDRMHGQWRRGRGLGRMFMLSKADINKDGVITWNEVQNSRKQYFDRFDTDGDGIISEKEIDAVVRKRVEKRVKRLTRWFDRDGDGKISKKEFDFHAKERFAWRDYNEDEKLSGDELPARFHRMQAFRRNMKDYMRDNEDMKKPSDKDDEVNKSEKKK